MCHAQADGEGEGVQPAIVVTAAPPHEAKKRQRGERGRDDVSVRVNGVLPEVGGGGEEEGSENSELPIANCGLWIVGL